MDKISHGHDFNGITQSVKEKKEKIIILIGAGREGHLGGGGKGPDPQANNFRVRANIPMLMPLSKTTPLGVVLFRGSIMFIFSANQTEIAELLSEFPIILKTVELSQQTCFVISFKIVTLSHAMKSLTHNAMFET